MPLLTALLSEIIVKILNDGRNCPGSLTLLRASLLVVQMRNQIKFHEVLWFNFFVSCSTINRLIAEDSVTIVVQISI